MKKLFSASYNANNIHIGLLVLRIAIGMLMLVHGVPKMMALFSGEAIQFPAVFGLSPALSMSLAVFAEVICSLMLIIGLGTRAATIPLLVTMMVAVFYIHREDPFATQELGLHYLLSYLLLLIAGPGRYSLDQVLVRPMRAGSVESTIAVKGS